MLVADKHGCFRFENYTMIPYQHHKSKNTWKVMVTRRVVNDENIEYEHEQTHVIAKTALEAATYAIRTFDKLKRSREDYLEWKREEDNKFLSRRITRN